MDIQTIQKCQKLIGYTFEDAEILSLALTHSSVAATRTESNERLEFLGDMVLGLVICQWLYEHPDDLMEGDMTKIKSTVVSRKTCADVAIEIGLCDVVDLGKGIGSRGNMPPSVAAALLESVIGAVYLDGGIDAAHDFILPRLQPYLDAALENEHQHNYKSLLQQHLQRTGVRRPDYLLLDEKGPDHSKCFEIVVCAAGRQFASAWGKTKKDAEQEAARRALVELGVLEDEDDDEFEADEQ